MWAGLYLGLLMLPRSVSRLCLRLGLLGRARRCVLFGGWVVSLVLSWGGFLFWLRFARRRGGLKHRYAR